MNEHLKESINDIKDVQNKFDEILKKSVEDSEEYKEGKWTTEEEMEEPGNVLFKAISEMCIKILQDSTINESFDIIGKELGVDATKALINVIAISMSHGSYNSILFYDDLLKKELHKQFDNVGDYVNKMKADLEGMKAVIKIHQNQLSEINNKLQISDFKDKNKIN